MISEAEYSALRDRFEANARGPAAPVETQKPAPKPRRGRMNKLEARFEAEVLKPLLDRGVFVWCGFEAIKLRLADGAWYTPDFVAYDNIGDWIVYECKGHWREAARVRIKVAADKYPFTFKAVTRDRKSGEWKFEHFRGRERADAPATER